ncbi:zinc-finger domain-containing protein [Anaplasma platys]|uniref:Zinc-finger domain-containing protein n=1 Tax=Anaplasma platys TaxID=949 RepID=A0A858PZH1_9RICK|nr:zinc-finger domain-containing protein [Anaplasma platys]QJC27960.1 zinc-finger domain-containing protein [Anaplasma platys]
MSHDADSGKVVACSGADDKGLFFGHPQVYVKIPPGESVPCPYCGKILS